MLTYQLEQNLSSKYYELYQKIKEDILSGKLKADEKLPSKRSLAEHLGISVITVETAYSMLKEEGYIDTRERSGYYVREIHGFGIVNTTKKEIRLLQDEPSQECVDELFPASTYFKTVRYVISEYGNQLLQTSPSEGCAILRNSIAEYLLRYRGLFVQPSQIIIGSGAEHLYGCVARIFGTEKIYGIEDPSYMQIEKVYEGTGAKVDKLRMTSEGIASDELERTKAKILHVTPFHSFPSGVTATIGKRYEYLEWAKEKDHYIVEDDFDSEFFMPGKPIETLFMLDQSESVIYINTFSKSLSPSIRMGYMILPERLMKRYYETSGGFSCSVPVLEQYALAEFISQGHFERHLNRVRRHRERMDK